METNGFVAIGSERRTSTSPVILLPAVGVFQLLVVVTIDQGPANALSQASVLIAIASFVSVLVLRMRTAPIGPVKVTVSGDRRRGGDLVVEYIDSKGRIRGPRTVDHVEAWPGTPLWRLTGVRAAVRTNVEGTASSLNLFFKGTSVILALGFPDDGQMIEARNLLK